MKCVAVSEPGSVEIAVADRLASGGGENRSDGHGLGPAAVLGQKERRFDRVDQKSGAAVLEVAMEVLDGGGTERAASDRTALELKSGHIKIGQRP